ncbi:transcriptional regulator [Effusibacillus lacus]|uniref:HTH-type transcriptional regulatory protein TyrR n=1 Tax=Effusibacillus lacus TaxID=1348429 RepID=A0A292YH81_9BACL|nr:transcriptional regulator [Effusibacillus lacus]
MLDDNGNVLFANQKAHSSFSIEKVREQLLKLGTEDGKLVVNGYTYHCIYTGYSSFHLWYLNDVTELERLQSSNQELEEIFNSSFDEIFVTDGEGVCLRVNPAGEKLYGATADQLIGKKVEDLSKSGFFNPPLTPLVIKHKRKMSGVQTAKNGKTLYVTGNPVFDEAGNIVRIIFNSRDLTDFKILERRLEETESLLSTYRTELVELTKTVGETQIVVQSESMQRMVAVVSKVAPVDSTLLITGESGVGKSKIAALIHEWSSRKGKPFIQVNCGAIPDALFESELFGYEGGAFTGARKEGKKGLIELAEGGTLFLDEIGELPLPIQVKLLEVIQEHKFRRVGGETVRQSNIRIIAATNQDLKYLVETGKFREDLFFRLNVIPIHVPPLRHRTEEIPLLIDLYLDRFNRRYGLQKMIDSEVREIFLRYRWPGNIRELENLIERLVLTSESSMIRITDLPDGFQTNARPSTAVSVNGIVPLKHAVEMVEAELLRRAHEEYGTTYKMAEVLKVNQSTIVRKLSRYQKLFKGD